MNICPICDIAECDHTKQFKNATLFKLAMIRAPIRSASLLAKKLIPFIVNDVSYPSDLRLAILDLNKSLAALEDVSKKLTK